MSEVRIAFRRAHFGPLHAEGIIRPFVNAIVVDRLCERRPARAGIEFVGRTEERIVRDYVDVNARLKGVPIFVAKSGLGAVFAHDAVLLFGQTCAQLGVARDRFEVIESAGSFLHGLLVPDQKECRHDGERAEQTEPKRQIRRPSCWMMDPLQRFFSHFLNRGLIHGRRVRLANAQAPARRL